MTPTVAHGGYSHKTHESLHPSSFPGFGYSTWWSRQRHDVSRIFSTERAVGLVLGAVVAVWGGWLLWELSRAIETYRVF